MRADDEGGMLDFLQRCRPQGSQRTDFDGQTRSPCLIGQREGQRFSVAGLRGIVDVQDFGSLCSSRRCSGGQGAIEGQRRSAVGGRKPAGDITTQPGRLRGVERAEADLQRLDLLLGEGRIVRPQSL